MLALYFKLISLFTGLQKRTQHDALMIVFCTVLLILNTVYWVTVAWFGDLLWVVHSSNPGGSEAYLVEGENPSVWYQVLGTAAAVISNLMSNALLVSCTLD